MLIILDDSTVLNMKEISNMLITQAKKKVKKKISGGFFGIDKFEEEEVVDGWVLKIEYTDNHGKGMVYTNQHSNYDMLRNKSKHIIEQLKMHDSGIINAAFEDAFLKDKK